MILFTAIKDRLDSACQNTKQQVPYLPRIEVLQPFQQSKKRPGFSYLKDLNIFFGGHFVATTNF